MRKSIVHFVLLLWEFVGVEIYFSSIQRGLFIATNILIVRMVDEARCKIRNGLAVQCNTDLIIEHNLMSDKHNFFLHLLLLHL